MPPPHNQREVGRLCHFLRFLEEAHSSSMETTWKFTVAARVLDKGFRTFKINY
jgi:hypothetical protein